LNFTTDLGNQRVLGFLKHRKSTIGKLLQTVLRPRTMIMTKEVSLMLSGLRTRNFPT